MSSCKRFDSVGKLTGKGRQVPGGGYAVPTNFTRTGVLEYTRGDGSKVRELRHPDEVFHPDSIASLAHAPATVGHPPGQMVNPANWKQFSVGHADDAKPADIYLSGDIVLQDLAAITKVDSGELSDVSMGYFCEIDPTPGVWTDGTPYDVVQRKIRYNHVSILPPGAGRAGTQVAIKLDSADAIETSLAKQQEDTTVKEIIDGVEYTVGSAEWRTALEKSLQKRADSSAASQMQERANQRAKLLSQRQVFYGVKGVRCDEAGATSDIDMMTQMVKMAVPGLNLEGASEDFVRGAYQAVVIPAVQAALEKPAEKKEPTKPEEKQPEPGAMPTAPTEDSIYFVRQDKSPARADASDIDERKARQDMIKKGSEAWRKPLDYSRGR